MNKPNPCHREFFTGLRALLPTLVLAALALDAEQAGAAANTPGGAPSSTAAAPPAKAPASAGRSNVEESQALVLLRGLPTLGTKHSVAIVELNPEATNFGAILQDFELPNLALPL